jgi:L-amino acid N-acyltransferase YncA
MGPGRRSLDRGPGLFFCRGEADADALTSNRHQHVFDRGVRKGTALDTPVISDVVVRPSTEIDVPAMVAIYAHHVRNGPGTFDPEPFRKRPAYRHAVKHSIYVHPDHLRSGVGRLLLPALIEACTAEGFRQMIGYVDAENLPSQQLHEAFGFHQAGLLQGVGYKFGRWTDTLLMQRALGEGGATPPVEPPADENYSRAT